MLSTAIQLSWADFQEVLKIDPPFLVPDDRFGSYVSIDGSRCLIGAPGRERDLFNDPQGAAYLYDINTGERLRTFSTGLVHSFGRGVALNNDVAAIAAPLDEEADRFAGAVYMFRATSGNQVAKLLPFSTIPDVDSTGAAFGNAIAMSEDYLVVGGK